MMPASLVETGIIFYPLIPQMEVLKKLEKL